MGDVITRGNRDVHRRVRVDDATLERVAEALGIPPAERPGFVSGTQSVHIYRRPPTPPRADTPQTPPAGSRS
jgi:hypothetical protein